MVSPVPHGSAPLVPGRRGFRPGAADGKQRGPEPAPPGAPARRLARGAWQGRPCLLLWGCVTMEILMDLEIHRS